MAGVKLQDLSELTSIASGDLVYVVDISDVTDGAGGTNKKVTRSNLLGGITGSPVGTIDAQTLTNKTIDADDNTISNLAHGAEVDNPSSGVHGVTGSIVGTTDIQTLTNKTLTSPKITEILSTNNNHELLGFGSNSNAVNYLVINNALSGSNVRLDAAGDDTNVGLQFNPKGSGNIVLADSNGNEVLVTSSIASAVNYIEVENDATGGFPEIRAAGDDTNISLLLSGKGTGLVKATSDFEAVEDAKFDGHAYFDAEVDNGNSGTADTIDWTAGNKQKSTVTGAVTYTFTAPSGPCNLILKLVNGGSQTITWPAAVLWPGGTEPSWTASGTDIVAFYYDGTNYYGQAGLDFS